MCIIILSAKEFTFSQRMGYGIHARYNENKIIKNSGKGEALPGAPTFFFCGKNIPALVVMSPKGSTTSEILKYASGEIGQAPHL